WNTSPNVKDESIRDFITRRLHAQFADYLFDPLTSGIYAGDISKLSMKSCFPLLCEWEKKYHSLIRGAWYHKKNPPAISSTPFIDHIRKSPLFSLTGGMGSIIKALINQLEAE